MPRPSHATDKLLLAAGRQVLHEQGFSGLTLRAVAAKAKVNLGMFSYHFQGKDDFVRQVAAGIYEEFFQDFTLQVEGEADPLEALRKGLVRLAFFGRDHQALVRSIVRDLMNGEGEAKRFAMANVPRHGKVIMGLVERCVKDGRMAKHPRGIAMTMIMSTVGFPVLMVEGAKAMGPKLPFKLTEKMIESAILGDEAIRLRIDLLLKALT